MVKCKILDKEKRYCVKITTLRKHGKYKARYGVKDIRSGFWVVGGIAKNKKEALRNAKKSIL